MAGLTIPVLRKEIPDEQQLFGFFQATADGAVICVDSRLSGSRELAVFLHELVHAIDDGAGLGLRHNQVGGLGEMLSQSLGRYLKF